MAETITSPYGFETRPEMVPFVPLKGRLLEAGCASGGFAHTLRAAGHSGELWGVEPDVGAADEARAHFDHVITGLYPDDLPSGERFDTVIFNDVLEHMVDPWETLRATAGILAPGGRVVASIPNIRYWPVVRDLMTRGRWTYTETGTLDRTHLRFFTRETIAGMFADAGYKVTTLEPSNLLSTKSLRHRYINWLPTDMRALQYAVVAQLA